MINKFVLSIFLFLLPFCSFSQQFKGTVKENDEPIIGAIVKIKDEKSEQTLKYDVTNSEGKFLIENIEYGEYILEVSHILYVNYQEAIDFYSGEKNYSFTLKREDSIIDDVIVSTKGNSLIRRGDTLIIQPSYYLSGYERDLKDVLEELPGFTIEENQVYYQGKIVNTFLLQEKELYGYNNSAILESLIPTDIENIQIIENYKTKSEQISSLDGDKIALNVELKKEALKLKGKLNAGLGDKGYETKNSIYDVSYRGGVTAFMKSNNVGNNVLSVADVANLSTNIKDFADAFTNNDLPRSLIDNNSSRGIGYSVGGSMINEFSKKTKLTSTILNSFGDRDLNYNIQRVDLTNNGISSFEEKQTNQNALTSVKNKLEVLLQSNTILESELNVDYTTGNQKADFSQRNSVLDDSILGLNPSIKISHKSKDSSWTFLLNSKVNFDFIKQDNTLFDQQPIFDENISEEVFRLSQNLDVEKQSYANELVLKPLKSNLIVNLKLQHQSQSFNFNTELNELTPQEFLFNDNIQYQTFGVEPKIRIKKNKFQFETIPRFVTKGIDRNNLFNNFLAIEGKHKINYNINSNYRYWLGYKNEINYLQPSQFQEQLRIKSITDISNSSIDFDTKSRSKSLFLGFFKSKQNNLNFTQIFYSYTIGSNVPYQNIKLFDSYVYSFYQLADRKNTHNISSNLSKEIMTKGGRSYFSSKFLLGKSNIKNQQSQSQNVGILSLRSKFNYKTNRWLQLTPAVNFTYSNGESFANESIEFLNFASSLKTKLFFGDFSINNKVELLSNRTNNNSFNARPIINSNIEYKGVKKCVLYISGEDLLNFEGMGNQRFNYFDTFYEIETYQQRPGFLLVGAEWKF